MNNKIIAVENALTKFLLASIVVLVFIAAVMRSFGYPIIWSVDFAQLFFIWLIMLGANQALRQLDHVGVDILVRNLSWRQRLKLDIFLYAIIAFCLVILAIYGFKLVLLNPQRMLGTTSISYAWVSLALPVGAILMLNTLLRQWWCLFTLLGLSLRDIPDTFTNLPDYVLQAKLAEQPV